MKLVLPCHIKPDKDNTKRKKGGRKEREKKHRERRRELQANIPY